MMAKSSLLSVLAATTVLLTGASATLDPIVIKGSKFFFKTNGTQFFIKGVAYQQGVAANGGGGASGTTSYVDPLADTASCTRDIPELVKLGANTIRTYALDPTLNHDTCMQLLDAAGIYVISDLGEPDLSIDRTNPEWNTELYSRYTAVVDAMSSYSNVIGFFAGNEVPNNLSYVDSTPFVKAAVRDTKAYIASKGYRAMGVGYAADDDATVRANVAAYLNCGDVASQIDFWGYNIYEWCGDSNYQESGYAARTAEFANYSVPAFFAEYGCNTQGGGAAGRKFTEIAALYGPDMSPVFSGGIVYEYFEETNDYGLVSVDGDSLSTLADFTAWQTQIAAVKPTSVSAAAYSPTNTVGQACPTVDASTWAVQASPLPPTPNEAACSCMVASLSCVASSSLNGTVIGELFAQVCGYPGNPCSGVARNASTGVYGAWSMCNATEQLSNAFDTYYKGQKSASTACNFGGAAAVVKPAAAASTCSSVIAQATASNPVSGSSSGSSAASSSKKNDASGLTYGGNMWAGKVFAVGFTITALLSGMGIILL
ncbi:carbohydrate-binding module family 43 protein [Hyaloscypha variabilis F]|uniref:1,3-beta-glucanosyltransferase n=1 Tax=Hyaloscypha variabilis (strain UAMH 11265 / GT02V1 / F) TaxID=1149755 RepID=A0A2J6RHU9_HYAVF|nr:carbohydrate-binding module family 43 protein [Hyaloscypha variabilis F]